MTLGWVWTGTSFPKGIKHSLSEMARIQVEMTSITFPMTGSPVINEDGSYDVGSVPE